MDNQEKSKLIAEARNEINSGSLLKAKNILLPLSLEGSAEALFLLSTFSIDELETDSEFENRSFYQLEKAAELGYPDAIFALANLYANGDIVDKDIQKASSLYEKAANLGHPKSIYYQALTIFYGNAGAPENTEKAKLLLQKALALGVHEAKDVLDRISGN